jgi:hypothetical protein
MLHSSKYWFALAAVAGILSATAWPQHSAPQSYTYTEDPATGLMGPSILKVARDGAKTAVDQILPVGPGRTKEFHNHILYDFAAHKIYTKLVSDPSVPCTVMDYTSPAVPEEFDLFASSAESMKELLAHAKQLGTETVNGIPAKVVELTSAEAKEKAWIADPGGYPVKVILTPPNGTPTTLLEVKQLSFAKPPAAALIPPSGCKAVKGEATATGVHAEFGSDDGASKPTTNVTAVTLQSVRNYTGPCPARIQLTGTIAVDGPGMVYFQFGAGTFDPGETVAFGAAGTRTVTHTMTFGTRSSVGHHIGIAALLEAVGEDANGKHDDSMQGSNNASFTVNCTDSDAHAAPLAAAPTPAQTVTARVTTVNLKVTPAEYLGECPVAVQLVGTITSTAPGTAYYQFQAGAVGASREGTVEIPSSGTTTVTVQGQIRRTPSVQSVRFLAGIEPRGHQENAKWTDVNLNLQCTNTP